MKVIRWSITITAALAATFIFLNPASAKTKKIWPSQFKPYLAGLNLGSMADALANAEHSYYKIAGRSTGSVSFMAPVRLPAGARINRFSINAYCYNPSTLIAIIYRQKHGETREKVAEIVKTYTVYTKSWLYTDDILLPVVKGGYRYWLQVYIMDNIPELYGVKIIYE